MVVEKKNYDTITAICFILICVEMKRELQKSSNKKKKRKVCKTGKDRRKGSRLQRKMVYSRGRGYLLMVWCNNYYLLIGRRNCRFHIIFINNIYIMESLELYFEERFFRQTIYCWIVPYPVSKIFAFCSLWTSSTISSMIVCSHQISLIISSRIFVSQLSSHHQVF